MTRKDKLREKLLNKASDKNWSLSEVESLLALHGYTLDRINGSHRNYLRDDMAHRITIPSHGGRRKIRLHPPTARTLLPMKHITKPSKISLLYPVRIAWSDDDEAYVATAPDFPGAVCAMDTESQALSEIRLIITGHIDSMQEHGESVPEPSAVETYEKARGMLSVSKLAAIMGVKRPTLASRIRRGRPPTREETIRLKKALAGLV